MTKQEKADCRKISEHYGWKVKSAKLIEEMGELKKAVDKVNQYKDNVDAGREELFAEDAEFLLSHMAEEIADVEICLRHMIYWGGEKFMQEKVKEY